MIIHRPANTRANPKKSWINSYRTFSFPPYFDPKYINFSYLQTINDDRVQPRGQVVMHEHKNMEIFGYVVSGTSTLNNIPLIEGDGLSFTDENKINIITNTETEIILFDLG